MIYHAKEGQLNIGNVRMDYIAFGSGSKPLVMIQGLNTRRLKGNAVMLAFMYRKFAKDYTVYLFDRRENLRDSVTVRELAEDVAQAMVAMGIRKADVLGVSQGGMIGQYLAIDHPDLVNKLVLAVTLARKNAVVESVIEGWIEMAERGAMKELVTDMAVKMYSEVYVKKYRSLIPLLTIVQKPKDVRRFVTLAKSCLTCNAYEELDNIQCPVLVIGGNRDRVVGGRASEEISEKLGCELYVYEELGHAAYEEAKDFNQRVYDFFQG